MEKLPSELSPHQYNSLRELFSYFSSEHASLKAFTCLGKTLTYEEIEKLSDNFAAYIQTHTDLQVGDKVAVQLLNVLPSLWSSFFKYDPSLCPITIF